VTGYNGNHTFVGAPFLVAGGDNLKRLTPSNTVGVEGAHAPKVVQVMHPDGTFREEEPQSGYNTKIEWSGGNANSETVDRITPLASNVRIHFDWITEDTAIPEDLSWIVADDYYRRFYYQFDYTFAGIQKWQQSCYDDYLVMSMAKGPSGYNCTTRVVSWPLNTVPEIHTPISNNKLRIAIIGGLLAPTGVLDTPTSGRGAVLDYDIDTKKLVLTNKRVNFKNFDHTLTASDGTYAKIEFKDVWEVYWVACRPSTGLTGLTSEP
jgi:hypothetical protein